MIYSKYTQMHEYNSQFHIDLCISNKIESILSIMIILSIHFIILTLKIIRFIRCNSIPRRRSPIAVYLASPQEIDLSPFVRKMLTMEVKIVAPRWNGETYELAVLRGLDDTHLRQGPMGILEPTEAEIVSPKEVEAWLVPGLAFTRSGKRLGYGGGWYDRLLAEAPKDVVKLGIAHVFQVVDDLPSEPHDILLSGVVNDG